MGKNIALLRKLAIGTALQIPRYLALARKSGRKLDEVVKTAVPNLIFDHRNLTSLQADLDSSPPDFAKHGTHAENFVATRGLHCC